MTPVAVKAERLALSGEIVRRRDAITFDVPSGSKPGVVYLVTFIGDPLRPERVTCNCPSKEPLCSHVVGAARAEQIDREHHRATFNITVLPTRPATRMPMAGEVLA